MRGVRAVLNGLKWTTGLDGVEVHYVHRGAPNDVAVISASRIVELGTWYFRIEAPAGRSGTIPYHRVTRVAKGSAVVWERMLRS